MDESIDPRHLLVETGKILEELGIVYAVTGGMAVFVWGRPRFTADIDIIIKFQEKDINLLAIALEKLHRAGYISRDMMRRAVNNHAEFNFIDGRSGIKVDFWVIGNSSFEKEQLKRRVVKEILGSRVYFVSPEDLILSKLRWHEVGGSTRQLEDIESIISVQNKLNKQYIKKWAKRHSTLELIGGLWEKLKK